MPFRLKIVMIVLALLVMIIIFRSVNKKNMRMQYSFVWILISIALLLLAFFPGIADWLCSLTGIQTPSNLIYLLGILALLMLNFSQTSIVSKQADQIRKLTQVISLQQYNEENAKEREVHHEEG